MIVVDTNTVSELLRPAPNARVLAWFAAQSRAALFTTAITRAEILYGVRLLPQGRRRQAWVEAVRAIFEQEFAGRMLAFDAEAADAYAEIAAARKETGRPTSVLDAMIAAVARSRGASVATRNMKDFTDCGVELVDPWSF